MPERILLATDSLEPSGVGEHILALAQGLRSDFDLVVAAPQDATGSMLERAERLGLRTKALAGDEEDFIAAERFDVVHVHAGIGWEGQRLSAVAGRAPAAIVVRTEHLPYVLTDPVQRAAYLQGIEGVSGLICVSAASATSFIEAGVPVHKISVVRNGIVAAQPRRGRDIVRGELGIAATAPFAVTVARLTVQKNHIALLAALPDILAAHPGFRLALVGTGPLERELREAATPLREAVLFLGHRNDVPDLLAAADLFVLPSLFEGLPLSLIEAMAAGLPAVASNVGGVDEVVEHGATGLLAMPGDLSKAMLSILNDKPMGAAMGSAARRRFETHFTRARMTRETREVYRRLGLPTAGMRSKEAT
jgi:glycosyltransferase involved in cell wall biosynthesis